MTAKRFTTLFAVAVLSLGLGIGAAYIMNPPDNPNAAAMGRVQTAAVDFRLPDLQGKMRHSKEWQGNVMLVNFWATWCPPCVREIPLLINLQETSEKYGLQIVGIAVDEAEKVKAFAEEKGINYPVLIGDASGSALAKQYGNSHGGLPYTVIFDHNGQIRRVFSGEIHQEETLNALHPLLVERSEAIAAAQ